MVNVKHPGPSVGGNTETHPHIQNVVLRALAGAVPERVAANEGATSCNFLFGGFHPEYGDYYTNYHIEGSGWGGNVDHDGNSVLCPNNGNCRNTPVEILETKYPFIVERYQIRNDSAGAGHATAAVSPAPVSSASPRRRSPSTRCSTGRRRRRAASSAGRRAPAAGIFIKRKGDTEFRRFSEVFGTVSDSKFTRVIVTEGDEIMLSSAGGGGYGDPRSGRGSWWRTMSGRGSSRRRSRSGSTVCRPRRHPPCRHPDEGRISLRFV